MEPSELKKKELETQEAILSVFMPSEPRDFFQKASAFRAGDSEATQDLQLDAKSYSKMSKLMRERAWGPYRDDLDGFIE